MAMASEMEYSQLVYIKKWYLEEALKQANAMIVNRLHELRASEIWGDGTSCASDARMFLPMTTICLVVGITVTAVT